MEIYYILYPINSYSVERKPNTVPSAETVHPMTKCALKIGSARVFFSPK